MQQGVAFTTGPNPGGYTLGSVTISMKRSGNPTPDNLVITLHSMEGADRYNNQNSYPSDTALAATLTGTPPTSTSYANTVFTCSGSGCDLDPGTTYFVVATYSGSGEYQWRYAGEDTQSGSPPGHGWKIERSHQKHSGSNWTSWADWHIVRADFTYNPSLTTSSVTATTATLTIAHHGSGAWHYKATTGPHTTCQGPVVAGTTTASLTGLTVSTSYTYSAYSDSGCSTLLATAAEFTTPTLTVSNIGSTMATLTIKGYTGAWHYKATTGPHTTCQAEVAAGTSTASLTGLTANTSYTYSAYSDSTCSTLLATPAASFTTAVSVSNLSKTATGGAILYSTYPRLAQAFTTGSNSGGYTLDKVTVHLQVWIKPDADHHASRRGLQRERPDRECARHAGERRLRHRRAHVHVQRLRLRPGCQHHLRHPTVGRRRSQQRLLLATHFDHERRPGAQQQWMVHRQPLPVLPGQ